MADKRFKIDYKEISGIARKVIASESAKSKFLDIIYCNDSLITKLNNMFLSKNNTTDVMAFNLDDNAKKDYLGEVYINLMQARRQSMVFEVDYFEEVKRLTIHGILHLLGYNDNDNKNRLKMWSRQESYLR